jgi:hypothetical protein
MSTMTKRRQELIAAAGKLREGGEYLHAAEVLEEIAAGKWTLVREPRYDAAVTNRS